MWSLGTSAQSYSQYIANTSNRVDSILYKVYDYERIGVKNTGSVGFDSATTWLVSKYTALGYIPQIDTFKFRGVDCYNVIVELPSKVSDSWVIVGAHYDSKTGSRGANDNGTGVIATLEIAKLLHNVELNRGIRIVNFGAEEDGLIGSSHYVRNVLDTSDDIRLMFNLDQLGGSLGQDNSKIVCERDEGSNPSENNDASYRYTDTLASMISLYTNLTPVISYAYSSDYEPFEDAGYVITGLYQESTDPYNHTPNDLSVNMDFVATTEVIKGAVAATMYFSGLPDNVSVGEKSVQTFKIYPNPTMDYFKATVGTSGNASLSILNALGQEVYTTKYTTNEAVEVSHLPAGSYSVCILNHDNSHKTFAKLIIAR